MRTIRTVLVLISVISLPLGACKKKTPATPTKSGGMTPDKTGADKKTPDKKTPDKKTPDKKVDPAAGKAMMKKHFNLAVSDQQIGVFFCSRGGGGGAPPEGLL